MGDEHGDDRHDEEHKRGHDRALAETRNANDAVATGAAGTQAGPEAYQKPRYNHDRQRGLYIDGKRAARRQDVDERAEQKARDEHRAPSDFRTFPGQQAANDAADPG